MDRIAPIFAAGFMFAAVLTAGLYTLLSAAGAVEAPDTAMQMVQVLAAVLGGILAAVRYGRRGASLDD